MIFSLLQIVIIDQDELDEDDGGMSGNISDTESNMGGHHVGYNYRPELSAHPDNAESIINEQEESDEDIVTTTNSTTHSKKSQKPKEKVMNKKYSKTSTLLKGKHKDNKDLFGLQGKCWSPKGILYLCI